MICDAVKNSHMSSIEELDDFAMGKVYNKVGERLDAFTSIFVYPTTNFIYALHLMGYK